MHIIATDEFAIVNITAGSHVPIETAENQVCSLKIDLQFNGRNLQQVF